MAVTMAEITKLRKMTGAGMMDCKNALTEAEGDMDKAMEIIRKKGQAVAAKRSDREAGEGCVLAKADGNYAAVLALKCETDFVAKNADFVALAREILDLAVANRCKTLDEIKNLPYGNATVAQAVTDRSGITGEKMELDGFGYVEAPVTSSYIHAGNRLAVVAGFNKEIPADLAHGVAMQIAAMNPLAVTPEKIDPAVVAREKEIAADKAREEGKPENMIEKIAMGRLGKFYKEVCLLQQEYVCNDEKKPVADILKAVDKDLTVTDFRRYTLNAE